jgi:hypothetical protein
MHSMRDARMQNYTVLHAVITTAASLLTTTSIVYRLLNANTSTRVTVAIFYVYSTL